MKAEEIFQAGVNVMKRIFTSGGMKDSIARSKLRSEEENIALLVGHRAAINERVRKIADGASPGYETAGVEQELIDAMVLRYLRNREIFMKTFPEGIDNIDADEVSIWAAMMISPQDEITTV
jgi:hypothetical protein